jgi:deazaflavin-dependent oxidoreductase (nitroreductase family)
MSSALPPAVVRFLAQPRVTRFAMRLATAIDRPLMRWSSGRLRLSFPIPLLLLECRGARSGVTREVPLLYVPDRERVLLVASNGGAPVAPAWCHNLRATRRATALVSGRRRSFVARELAGAEYDDAWRRAVALYPGYDAYRQRVARPIPIFALDPVEET